jgi:hypothetical protein
MRPSTRPFRLTIAAAAALTVAAAFSLACDNSTGPDLSGVPKCGSTTLLSASPMAYADIREIAPLGNLNPPGHVFPTDHIYLYANVGPAVTVVSPGKIRVTQVLLQKRTGGGQAELDDYGLDFYPCTGQHFWFAHLGSLSASLSAKLGALDKSCNAPYSTGGFTYTQCRKDVKVDLAAGDTIGTAGGPTEGALDLGAIDDASPPLVFVDPARVTGESGLHGVCPVDYFVADVRDSLRARFAVSGMTRTIAPVCGTIAQDIAGTAQGRWFFDATTQEDPHLALVHANWDPTIGAFSIGTSLPGTGPTVLLFTPATGGRVNRDFGGVTPDGNIYCYEFTNSSSRAFVQLTSTTQLTIAMAGTGACGDSTTWAFGGGAVAATYRR